MAPLGTVWYYGLVWYSMVFFLMLGNNYRGTQSPPQSTVFFMVIGDVVSHYRDTQPPR